MICGFQRFWFQGTLHNALANVSKYKNATNEIKDFDQYLR